MPLDIKALFTHKTFCGTVTFIVGPSNCNNVCTYNYLHYYYCNKESFILHTNRSRFFLCKFFESSHSSVGKILEKNYGNMFTTQRLILQLCQALCLSDTNQCMTLQLSSDCHNGTWNCRCQGGWLLGCNGKVCLITIITTKCHVCEQGMRTK